MVYGGYGMGNNIRKIRKEKRMTIEELAELSGLSKVYLYHLENGTRNNPSYEVMKKVSIGLARTIEDVFLRWHYVD